MAGSIECQQERVYVIVKSEWKSPDPRYRDSAPQSLTSIRRVGNHKKGHGPCPILQALSRETSASKRLFRSQTNLTILSVWLKSLARRKLQILNGTTPRSTTGQPQTRLALRASSEAIL